MELLFCESEPAFSDFTATREYLEQHGRPVALYSDKAGVFHVNAKEARGGDGVTQFARAMHSLNIDIICANTPTAKGRVERAHLTLQDRLVKALRLRGIIEIESANAFAKEYRADYNRRFARAARSEHDAELLADPVPARRDRRGPRRTGPARRRRGARGWRPLVLVRRAGAARHRLPQGARSSARRGRGEQETQRSSGVHEGPTEATRRRSSREDFDDPPRRQTASRRNTKEDNSTSRPMREDRTFLLWRKPDICTLRGHPPPTATGSPPQPDHRRRMGGAPPPTPAGAPSSPFSQCPPDAGYLVYDMARERRDAPLRTGRRLRYSARARQVPPRG